jgi:hypothetical protein
MATVETTDRPRLYTWAWGPALKHEGDDITLVRISLGTPRWAARVAAGLPYIEELAPAGCFKIRDIEGFRRCYFERLERAGVEQIQERFQELIDEHDGRPLVLLCFEKARKDCHRGDFAEWWLQRTGERIDEFDPAPESGQAVLPLADPQD